jgi:ACT domain-containing protein
MLSKLIFFAIMEKREVRVMINLVITVVGQDQVGIVAKVSSILAAHQGNIIDLSQRVMSGGLFTMIMQISLLEPDNLLALEETFGKLEKELSLKIMVQREDVFRYMHRV